MKILRFIRHAKAASSYSSYDEFPFEEFCKLAKGEFDPKIEEESKKKVTEAFKDEASSFDEILHSGAVRTRQTAEIIKQISSKNIPVAESANIKEIFFDPKFLTTPEEFKDKGLDSMRMKLFEYMIEGKEGVESINNVFKRIENLKKDITTSTYSSVLCVTHSFFMRVLLVHFIEGLKKEEITAQKLFDTHDYTYLDGFAIEL